MLHGKRDQLRFLHYPSPAKLIVRRWQRVPVLLRAVVTGLAVLFLGVLPWAGLVAVNVRVAPRIPWAVVFMALYGRLFIKYLNGWGWPRSTASTRRSNLRLRLLSGRVWIWAFASGGSPVGALLALAFVGLRLGTVPARHARDQKIWESSRSLEIAYVQPASIHIGGYRRLAKRARL